MLSVLAGLIYFLMSSEKTDYRRRDLTRAKAAERKARIALMPRGRRFIDRRAEANRSVCRELPHNRKGENDGD